VDVPAPPIIKHKHFSLLISSQLLLLYIFLDPSQVISNFLAEEQSTAKKEEHSSQQQAPQGLEEQKCPQRTEPSPDLH
jgi:hypothetical protein